MIMIPDLISSTLIAHKMNPIPYCSWNDNSTLLQKHDDVVIGRILRHPFRPTPRFTVRERASCQGGRVHNQARASPGGIRLKAKDCFLEVGGRSLLVMELESLAYTHRRRL